MLLAQFSGWTLYSSAALLSLVVFLGWWKMSSAFGSAFGSVAKGNNGRFSLLLLDENEYFFEDHSAVFYHPRPNQRGMSIQQRQATPVRLWIHCFHSCSVSSCINCPGKLSSIGTCFVFLLYSVWRFPWVIWADAVSWILSLCWIVVLPRNRSTSVRYTQTEASSDSAFLWNWLFYMRQDWCGMR